jgi:shikimate kinase
MENRNRYENLFLIGFSGSGKSSVGKLLAKKLKFNFLDTDIKIEANLNMKINEIITRKGEDYFRKMETECLNEINYDSKMVISTGGGIPTIKENLKIMNHFGIMIWLNSTIKTIIRRLEKSKEIRPLLGEKISENEITSLFEQREKYYQLAKFSIKTDNKNLNSITEEIKNKLSKLNN